jgi:hypothetical protein
MRIKKEAIILCELWLFFVAPPNLRSHFMPSEYIEYIDY